MAAALRRHLGGGNVQAQKITAAEQWRATVTPCLATTSPAARPSGPGTLGTLAAGRYQLVPPRKARAAQASQQERGRAEARAHLQPGLQELGWGLDAASHDATDRAAEQRGQQRLALLTEHEANAGSADLQIGRWVPGSSGGQSQADGGSAAASESPRSR